MKVSIIPSSRTDEETKQHLSKFTRDFSEEEFNEDGIFAGLVNDVSPPPCLTCVRNFF